MEWLISHPEEAPMEAAPAPAPPQNDQVPAVAKEMNLAPAQVLLPSNDPVGVGVVCKRNPQPLSMTCM